jgi:hypothetical protein
VANESWTQLDFRQTEKARFNWIKLMRAKREILLRTEKRNLIAGIFAEYYCNRRDRLTCQGNVGLYLLRHL